MRLFDDPGPLSQWPLIRAAKVLTAASLAASILPGRARWKRATSGVAQSIVRDFLGGSLILLEDRFDVGDEVRFASVGGPVDGVVEGLTLRSTTVRTGGSPPIVPNGYLQLVENRSRRPGTAELQIPGPGRDGPARSV